MSYTPIERVNVVHAFTAGHMEGKKGISHADALGDYIKQNEQYFSEQSKPKEYILIAANYYQDGNNHQHQPDNINTGFVVCGRRHHNCITMFAMIMRFPYDAISNAIRNTEIQGFLTNTNRFVDRKEAYTIAYNANQIIGPNKGRESNEIGLTSEDLY